MDTVFEKSKQYEFLVTTFDPVFNDLIKATEIVKKFIIDKGMIIYGGTAMDYALRLRGDKIYPDDMLLVPDLDMYSMDNVEHAYTLADILYKAGFKEVRAINALHMETMKVDLIDNHFIADITYKPNVVFETLPYLEYNGMRIIHPNFQRIDLHSSLAFPYDNVPREVIFDRWNKDVKRFNKLCHHYPIDMPSDMTPTRSVSIPHTMKKYVFNGFAAYAILYTEFTRSMKNLDADIPENIIPAKFTPGDNINFDTLDQTFEIAHFDISKCAKELGLEKVKMFEPLVNMIPKRIEGVGICNITIYSTKNRLVTSNSVKIDEHNFRIVNIQYLLKHFLSMYFAHAKTPKTANTYLARYVSLLNMISAFESALESKSAGESMISSAMKSPLQLSIQTYGNENINIAREVALNKLYSELDGVEPFKIPRNYYPDRSIPKGLPHPPFNPEEVEFFREQGRQIPNVE